MPAYKNKGQGRRYMAGTKVGRSYRPTKVPGKRKPVMRRVRDDEKT